MVTATPDDTLVQAAVDLAGRRIGCLPVVRQDVLVGIVTEMDLVSAFVRHTADAAAGDDANPWIDHLMTWHPTTTTADTSLAEARRLMRVNDIRHLPVLQEGFLEGMLSDRDLRRAYGAGRSKDTEVGEVMTRDLVTLTVGDSARAAAAGFVRQRISALPILAADSVQTLVGIVTISDLLQHYFSTLGDSPCPTSAG